LIYLDSTYLVRLYFEDPGYERVRQLAASDAIACAQHGRAEVISAFHRKLRERTITARLYGVALQQFRDELRADAFRWLFLSDLVLERLELAYAKLPATAFLRAADALHLSTARSKTADSRCAFWAARHRCDLVKLRTRMSVRVGFFQAFHCHVRVDLRCGKAGVPQ
jgi:predicted nucleic acid-binding protein